MTVEPKNTDKEHDVAPDQGFVASIVRHSLFDDAQGILASVVIVTLALSMFVHLGLVTGGIAGLSLVISYAFGWSLGSVIFVLNLPFYVLAYFRLGLKFTLKTLIAVSLMSLLLQFMPSWVSFDSISPLYGALVGGLLAGFGFIALFRHRASLGGFGIVAVWLQDKFGWRAGWTQLGLDVCVFALAAAVVSVPILIYSFIGAVVLNLVLAINHREGRYFGG